MPGRGAPRQSVILEGVAFLSCRFGSASRLPPIGRVAFVWGGVVLVLALGMQSAYTHAPHGFGGVQEGFFFFPPLRERIHGISPAIFFSLPVWV